MPRRSGRKAAKSESDPEPVPEAPLQPNDNVVMMVLPPNIAEELAKSGGQLTPELLTAIAQSEESFKPVPLQIEPTSSDKEEPLGSTTSIKVTNSEPSSSGVRNLRRGRGRPPRKSECPEIPEISSSLPSDSENESPVRVTRNSPKKGKSSYVAKTPTSDKTVVRKRGRPRKVVATPNSVQVKNNPNKKGNKNKKAVEDSDEDFVPPAEKPAVKRPIQARKNLTSDKVTEETESADSVECEAQSSHLPESEEKSPVNDIHIEGSGGDANKNKISQHESVGDHVLDPVASDSIESSNENPVSRLTENIDELDKNVGDDGISEARLCDAPTNVDKQLSADAESSNSLGSKNSKQATDSLKVVTAADVQLSCDNVKENELIKPSVKDNSPSTNFDVDKPLDSDTTANSISAQGVPRLDLEKSGVAVNSNLSKVQCPLEYVNSFPASASNIAEEVKDDSLGITQDDLKQLDAVLSTDQAKAILDTIPIEELLDQPIEQTEKAVLDGMKNFGLHAEKDLLEVLDVGSSDKSFENENTNYLSNLVFMDHSYFLDPNADRSQTGSDDNSALDDNIRGRKATSPTRRSQRQQDKILKEQAEKIRAENVAAHKRELEEMARLKNEEKDKLGPVQTQEEKKDEEAAVLKMKEETAKPVSLAASPLFADSGATSDVKKIKMPSLNKKEKTDDTISSKGKPADKAVKREDQSTDSKPSFGESKDLKHGKHKDPRISKFNSEGKIRKIIKHREQMKGGIMKQRTSTERRHSLGSKISERKRKLKLHLSKPAEKSGLSGHSDAKKIGHSDAKKSGHTAERSRTLSLNEGTESGSSPEKPIVKKEKKIIKKTPDVSYISLEPALFSQPDIFVTKNKDEETVKCDPTSPQFKAMEMKRQLSNKEGLVKKESKGTSEIKPQKQLILQKTSLTNKSEKNEKKHDVKEMHAVLEVKKPIANEIPKFQKPAELQKQNSLDNSAKKGTKPKLETDCLKAAARTAEVTNVKQKCSEEPETLNDIIAELSSSTESPERLNKPAKTLKHKKVEKFVVKVEDKDVSFRDVKEVDSVRKSYPKRVNRRLPAHFKMFDQEVSLLKAEKSEDQEVKDEPIISPSSIVADLPVEKVNKNSNIKETTEAKKEIVLTDQVAKMLDGEDSDNDILSDDSWCSEDDPERLWCICRSPHDNRFMICCDKCEDWFHGSCVGVSKKDGNLLANLGKSWFCPICVKQETEAKGGNVVKEVDGQNVPKTVKSEKEDGEDSKIKLNHKEMKKVFEKVHIKQQSKPSLSTDQSGCSKEKEKSPQKPSYQSFKSKSYKRFKRNKPSNLCITTGCQNLCKAKSNFCSDECIRIYSNDSIRFLKNLRDNKKISDASQIIPILESQSRKLISSKDSPTDATLSHWLMENQGCEVVQIIHVATSKPKEHVRKPSVSESSTKPAKNANDQSIRKNVCKMLFDALDSRLKSATDMKMNTEEVKKISDSIERELYHYHRDLGMKYKSKCRSLVFNIRDAKNHGLFRKVLKAGIKPHKLVRMTTEEMASKELAEWRERENKHSLEIIKKDEEDRMKKILKQQTLEKIEIFENKTADIDSLVETSKALKDAEKLARIKTTKDPSHKKSSHQESKKSSEHGSKKKSKKSSKEQHSSSSKSKSSSSHYHDKGKSHSKSSSSSHSKSKNSSSSHSKSSPSVKSKPSSASKDTSLKSSSKSSNHKHKSSDSTSSLLPAAEHKDKSDTPLQPSPSSPTPPAASNVPKKVIKPVLEPRHSLERQLYQKPPSIWKGFITVPDVTQFIACAAMIYGPKGSFGEEPPNSIKVCGRIHPKQVFDYLEEVKTSPTRQIVVVRFDPASDDEKLAYISFYEYLNIRKRYGVVNNFSSRLKDFYLLPLACNELVPETLRNLEGPGLAENHPHMLIGVLVVKAPKRAAGETASNVVPAKTQKISQSQEETPQYNAAKVPERPYTPPLTEKLQSIERSTTPPLNQKVESAEPKPNHNVEPCEPQFSASDEPYEPSFTPPPPAAEDEEDIPYSPTHETVIDDDEDEKPYDPEESVNDLQKLKDLQYKLQQKDSASEFTSQEVTDIKSSLGSDSLSAGLASSSNFEKQNRILIELTKRVEEQTSALKMQIAMANENKLPIAPKTEDNFIPPSVAAIAAKADSISLPPNLAEILKNVKNKSSNPSQSQSDDTSASTSQNLKDDPIVKNFAHYSPTDDYGYKNDKGLTPPGTPPKSNADDEPKTPPLKMPRYDSPSTSSTIQTDPRLSKLCDNKGNKNNIIKKDPRQKSSSLKNMTESELLERARKQLEEMDKDTTNTSVNNKMSTSNMLPPLPPPQMFNPNFPPPPPPLFPPRLDRPPPPVPNMTWTQQPVGSVPPPLYPENMDKVTAVVLDYAKTDHPPSAWDQLPPVMMQKRRRKSRRQHEHWRGLKERWQNKHRFGSSGSPASLNEEDASQPGGSQSLGDLEEGECPDVDDEQNKKPSDGSSYQRRGNFKGRGFFRGKNGPRFRGNFQFRKPRDRHNNPDLPDS